jgi:hypothetical protein
VSDFTYNVKNTSQKINEIEAAKTKSLKGKKPKQAQNQHKMVERSWCLKSMRPETLKQHSLTCHTNSAK